ncbi:MAG: hypothetical protein ABIJ09_02725 [Pseudomonadota bacterium]
MTSQEAGVLFLAILACSFMPASALCQSDCTDCLRQNFKDRNFSGVQCVEGDKKIEAIQSTNAKYLCPAERTGSGLLDTTNLLVCLYNRRKIQLEQTIISCDELKKPMNFIEDRPAYQRVADECCLSEKKNEKIATQYIDRLLDDAVELRAQIYQYLVARDHYGQEFGLCDDPESNKKHEISDAYFREVINNVQKHYKRESNNYRKYKKVWPSLVPPTFAAFAWQGRREDTAPESTPLKAIIGTLEKEREATIERDTQYRDLRTSGRQCRNTKEKWLRITAANKAQSSNAVLRKRIQGALNAAKKLSDRHEQYSNAVTSDAKIFQAGLCTSFSFDQQQNDIISYPLFTPYEPDSVLVEHWKGEYYANCNLAGAASEIRDDGEEFLQFAQGHIVSPVGGPPGGQFSVHWEKQIYFTNSDTYQFIIERSPQDKLMFDAEPICPETERGTQSLCEIYVSAGNHTISLDHSTCDSDVVPKITWEQKPRKPVIRVTPDSLYFTGFANGPSPISQEIYVDIENGNVQYIVESLSVEDSGNWLVTSGQSDDNPNVRHITVDAEGLTPGTYKGAVYFSYNQATNSPLALPVNFVVSKNGADQFTESMEKVGETLDNATRQAITVGPSIEFTIGENGVEGGNFGLETTLALPSLNSYLYVVPWIGGGFRLMMTGKYFLLNPYIEIGVNAYANVGVGFSWIAGGPFSGPSPYLFFGLPIPITTSWNWDKIISNPIGWVEYPSVFFEPYYRPSLVFDSSGATYVNEVGFTAKYLFDVNFLELF